VAIYTISHAADPDNWLHRGCVLILGFRIKLHYDICMYFGLISVYLHANMSEHYGVLCW
jgi:hypothetical protein